MKRNEKIPEEGKKEKERNIKTLGKEEKNK